MKRKNCRVCGRILKEPKPNTQFCAECGGARTYKSKRGWVAKNKEHIREYNREYMRARRAAAKGKTNGSEAP